MRLLVVPNVDAFVIFHLYKSGPRLHYSGYDISMKADIAPSSHFKVTNNEAYMTMSVFRQPFWSMSRA